MNLAILNNPIKITLDVHHLGVLSSVLQQFIAINNDQCNGYIAFADSILISIVQKMEGKRQTKLLKGDNKKFNFSLAYHQAYMLRDVINAKPSSNDAYVENVIRLTIAEINKQLL